MYGGVSFRGIFAIVALFALLLAPLRMAGGEAAAMPHHGAEAMASGHCAGSDEAPADAPKPAAIDCTIACSAMPAIGAPAPAPAPAAADPHRLPTISVAGGRTPESDPPPPRTA